MNKGTKIRTALAVLTTINTVLAVTDVTQFGNEKLNMAYKIISVIVNGIIVGINTWYDNNYTPEACEGTGWTRQQKRINRGENIDIPAEAVAGLSYLKDGDEDE
jgi:hypothetical protein